MFASNLHAFSARLSIKHMHAMTVCHRWALTLVPRSGLSVRAAIAGGRRTPAGVSSALPSGLTEPGRILAHRLNASRFV